MKNLYFFRSKKLRIALLLSAIGISVLVYARVQQAKWVSSCGYSHVTTFTGNWSISQIKQQIALINEVECGVRPIVSIN
ncbi:hypothetical protein [Elizabethkingia meningoseptica]|uniref:hypothetical protein n=1 Tax=Elizabethkingia meningoseptica TaxID=238 RepID=UPI00136626A1|nr:hypothetical protein [Elizabethkingia meningoseptica]MDE5490310.1 hypothetical protein [Elizabethkingia meningoseptica]MVW92189.1 hypothetical protein [Elizabethkingia meningoseptica]